MEREAALRAQHQQRMSFMPHLYFAAPEHVRRWAVAWQREVHRALCEVEAVEIDEAAFIAPTANIFAEPRRPVTIGAHGSVAAHALVHGPVALAEHVSINPYCVLEGGAAGIEIGASSRIAAHVSLYAFEHGIAAERLVREQKTRSLGIRVGEDVWIGTRATVTDGVSIGDHAVVGAGAVVTRDVEPWMVVAGVPARVIGDRRTWK